MRTTRRAHGREWRNGYMAYIGPDTGHARGCTSPPTADGRVLTDPEQAIAGEKIVTRLAKGTLHSTVTKP